MNDIPRNSFNDMEKEGPPPEYSPSCSNNGGHPNDVYGDGVVTADIVQEHNPPPAYDDIFVRTVSPVRRERSCGEPCYRDDRNLWEKLHDWFEMSILQQIIWLVVLAFSLSYIAYGIKYSGSCSVKKYNKKGKMIDNNDITGLMQAEGGVLCATVLFVLMVRLLILRDNRRTQRKLKIDLEGQKKCGGYLFFIGMGLYIANFGLCIGGATNIMNLYTQETNTTVRCDSEFYHFYYHAKIGELVVLMPYAAYIIFSLVFMMSIQKQWFIRRKLRRWAKLLDADQDGVISQDDMMKTNEKLERLRKLVGARQMALSASKQKKWWDDNVFKRGPGKDIHVEEYVTFMEGTLGTGPPHDRAIKIRPVVKKWFDFFTTEEYMKKKLILGEEDFVKFWTILDKGDDESHYKRMYIKHFPSPLSMGDIMEDFVAFLSHPDFFDEYSNRVFNVVKHRPEGTCCKL